MAIGDPVVRPIWLTLDSITTRQPLAALYWFWPWAPCWPKGHLLKQLSRDEPVTSGLVVGLGAGLVLGGGLVDLVASRQAVPPALAGGRAPDESRRAPPALVADDDDLPYRRATESSRWRRAVFRCKA